MNAIRRVGRLPFGSAVLIALFSSISFAQFVRFEIEQVPVDRVVGNLGEIAKREPQNAEVRVNLARAHAMANALRAEFVPMVRVSAELARANADLARRIRAAEPWVASFLVRWNSTGQVSPTFGRTESQSRAR